MEEQGARADFRLVTGAEEARGELARFEREPVVGLDTETYWDWRGKKCCLSLVQLCAPEGPPVVIDALRVDPSVLRPLVESPAVQMAAHNARFDHSVLRGVGLTPHGFVDTLRLAHVALELPAYGLADVVQHLFGVPVDKSLQRSAWGKRPLAPEQLAYAAADARWSLRLYAALRERLEQAGRWEEALAYAALAPRPPGEEGEAAPKEKRRRAPAPPGPPLSAEEQALVVLLKRWRMDQARQARCPAYMVCPDRTLEQAARARPATLEALASLYGLGEAKIKRYGESLLAALRAAPPPGG